MPRRDGVDDDWHEDEEGFEPGDDDTDLEDDDDEEEPTVPCPYCRRQIYEDAQRCPYCENYISAEDAPTQGSVASQKPLWFVVGMLLCLFIVILWIIGSR